MTNERKRSLAQLFLVLTILSAVMSCGSCGACMTTKFEYGPEEFYQKGNGEIGYGADLQPSATRDRLTATFFLGAMGFILFGLTSVILKGRSLKKEDLPEHGPERNSDA